MSDVTNGKKKTFRARLSRMQFLREERGSALIELGIVLAVLGVPTMLGTTYMGILLFDSIQVSNAAHAGAMYGMRSSTYAEENSYIISAAQNEAPNFGTNLTVVPTMFYACSNNIAGTQYSTQAAATSGCAGSSQPLQFLKVVASASVTPLGKVTGMPKTVTLSSTSVMEVEE